MDYQLESTFDFKFSSRAFDTGIPTTLAGTPVVEIYEDNSTTQITGAETLTVDFDSVTGFHNLRIAATAANGFESGKSYSAVLSAGTVGGVSVVGETICNFTIERSAAALEIGAAGAGLTDLGGMSTAMKAEVNAEADTALTDYDPPTKAEMDTGHGLLATEAKQDTAQADLDTLTGSDGATLATSQGNYAPSKAGDAMALTSGERTTLAAAIWNALTSGMATVGSIGKKLADWTVGTIDTYTGNTKQTGDTFAKVGTVTDLGDGATIGQNLRDLAGDTFVKGTDALETIRDDVQASAIRAAVGLASANLDTQLSTIDTVVDGIQTDLDNATDGLGALKALIDGLNDLDAAAVGDGVLDEVFEGTTTLREFLRLSASALYGKLEGAATTTVTIRDEADSKDRITATVDADGNRTAVTLDKS